MMGTTTKGLTDYIHAHTTRGECRCGRCCDVGQAPDPTGHVADVYFFTVGKQGEPTAEELLALVRAHRGEFNDCDPFDGNDHSYIELGGWLGDQGTALQFIGLCELLGLGKVLTPKMLPLPKELQDQMAGAGYVSVQRA